MKDGSLWTTWENLENCGIIYKNKTYVCIHYIAAHTFCINIKKQTKQKKTLHLSCKVILTVEYLLFASSLPDSKAPGEQAHPPRGACVQLTAMFKFLFGSLIHNRHKDKILKECTDLLRVLILQISSSLLQVWRNNLADGNRTMLRGISVGGSIV